MDPVVVKASSSGYVETSYYCTNQSILFSASFQPVCTLYSGAPVSFSSNLALWAPQRGCQGVYIGTQTGAVVHWGLGQVGRRKKEETLGLTVKWHSGDDEEEDDVVV